MTLNETKTINIDKYTYFYENVLLSKNYLEKFFIALVASLGLLGSVYTIASSSNAGNQPDIHNLSLLVAASTQDLTLDENLEKGKFKDYISIDGNKKVGNRLDFTFTGERTQGTRFMADMGDGTRIMIRTNKFSHTYETEGKFNISIKKTRNAVITTLAEKEIKIK